MTAMHSTDLSQSLPLASDETTLLDLILVFAKHKKLIISLPIMAGLLAAAVVFSLPSEYTATLKIAPSKNAAIYNWVLTNDQVQEQLVSKMKLAEHFGTKGRQATNKAMAKAVRITLNARDGFLDVSATDENPEFAALLANNMGLALQSNLYDLRLLDISKQRYDLEVRRELAQKNKNKFDLEMKKPELAATIMQLSATDQYGITSLAAIQAEMALQGSGPDLMQNEMVRLQDQLSSLQRLVVEGMKKPASSLNSGVWIASVNALQQQTYWDALIERVEHRIELLKKIERDELKMTLAEVPDDHSGPKREMIIFLSMFAALCIGMLWAYIVEAIAKSRENSQSLALLAKIAAAWRTK